MQMTEAEIVRSYQHAENRTKQISILAELNACSKAEIRDILEKNGEEVPHYGNRYTGKVKEVTKASGSKRKLSGVRMSERRKKKNELKEAVEDISVGLNAMVRDAAEGLNKVIKDNPADSSDLSARLLKSEEPSGVIKSDEPTAKDLAEFGEAFMQGVRDGLKEDVGTCQQDVGTMSEDLGLSFEHSPEEMLKARSTAPTACQPAQPVNVWKSKKKESVPVPPEVIDAVKRWLRVYEKDIEELEQKKKEIDEELENGRKTAERIRAWLETADIEEGET